MVQFTPLEIWKQYAILMGIFTGISNTTILEDLGINDSVDGSESVESV